MFLYQISTAQLLVTLFNCDRHSYFSQPIFQSLTYSPPMDALSHCSDPHPFTSLSESSNQRSVTSDEEIILSSSRPKKRAGRKKFKETRHPVYRGIRRKCLNSSKWVCELREPSKQARIWLGTYPTAEMAARAYDVAALALRGHSACLNFADSVWRLPVPASNDPKDIRKAAAEAAEAFRPQQCDDDQGSATSAADHSGGEEQEITIVKNSDEVQSGEERKMEISEANSSQCDNSGFFMDDEALFDMPGLLMNMAEGLLLSPPHCLDNNFSLDDVGHDADMSLWTFPF